MREWSSYLARLRKSVGWSQTDLARELGVTRQYVQRIESGRVGVTVDQVLRITRALGRPVVVGIGPHGPTVRAAAVQQVTA